MPEPVDPVSQTDDGGKHTVAYGANDIISLEILEISCERDEANLFADIKEVARATDDGVNVTAVIYEDVDDFEMGHLTFVKYQTDVDEQSLKAIHKAQGETFLFKGEAYVNKNPVKVLVFREKSQ